EVNPSLASTGRVVHVGSRENSTWKRMVLPMKTRYEGFRVRALSVALILFVMVGMTLASGGLAVAADDYPTKPITMIVAFSPGGGTDVAARTVAKYAEQYLGQRIVAENRPGAGGQI